MSLAFTPESCPACYWPIIISWGPPAGPVSDVVQEALGGSVEALLRFFSPDEVLRRWELPLVMTWGRSEDWRAIADLWRATRLRREGGFLSLAEINAGWDGGE